MSKQPKEYLKHILVELEFLDSRSSGMSLQEFLKDEVKTRAFSRSLEIIGEASKNLPDEFRKNHTEIDWKAVSGMRDRLIHHYFGVDYEIVWDVVENEVPKLKGQIESILKE